MFQGSDSVTLGSYSQYSPVGGITFEHTNLKLNMDSNEVWYLHVCAG